MPDSIRESCRLCTSKKSLLNVFQNDNETLSPHRMVNSLLGIKIYPGDLLPHFICQVCNSKLKSFYSFKLHCLHIQEKITNVLEGINDEMKRDIKNEQQVDSNITDSLSEFEAESGPTYKKKRSITSSKEHIAFVKLQCHLCGYLFKTKKSLENHSLCHSDIKKYSCSVCSKSFTRLAQQKIHARAHLGIKPFICDLCGKGSTRRQDLVRHMKVHSDEKNYNCPFCEKVFKRNNDVVTHLRVHTGEKPYSCKWCEKEYKSYSSLKKHFSRHHMKNG